MSRDLKSRRGWVAASLLLATVLGLGGGLAAWKFAAIRGAAAASASQPEPTESVTASVARAREHRRSATSIGTVLALRSVTLRNEVAGTVRRVMLRPGQIVEAGTVLVGFDVSVEAAELAALKAEAALAETRLDRLERLRQQRAASQEEADQARAERDVALAQITRTRAVIARKVIRAPFRARVGIADVHPGQYLNEGTQLTTLQGVADAAHVDFAVAQRVAAALREGDSVGVVTGNDSLPTPARIVAIDVRVDSTTRNALVRARLVGGPDAPSPGASVRVVVPVGEPSSAVVVPASALRKGPGGDHVFVIEAEKDGRTRAHLRQVQSGPVLGDEVMILAGLSAGERVATSGSFKLREAVLVAVAGDTVADVNGGR
ncbi:MAG: efflux RND transporter periplasmic adaptor subunit [Gemmatimonadota bacterium]|nr:efflux RND transporter periplasmic adaptor subunit [Gemmatimonadota bacterium]